MSWAALVYLAYFAKFLSVNAATVTGADSQVAAQILSSLQDYESQHPYGLPQSNIVLFMPNRFASFLAAGDPQISQVVSVHRKLWHTVAVSVVQRVPTYALQVNGLNYTVYSDGTLGGQIDQPQGTTIVDSTAGDPVVQGSHLFTQQQVAFVKYVAANFSKLLPLAISHFEVNSEADTTFTVVAQNGARFLFDDTSDPSLSLSRLQTLWGQLTPSQQAKLAYFDMRFDPKAYGCYKGDPCAATVLPPTATPSPSPTPTPGV